MKYTRTDSIYVVKDWHKQRKRDHYYRLAKKEKYRSRAAYKLLQINERFSVLRRGNIVVDLGCAPGGWSQVAIELVGEKGKVIGVDMKNIAKIRDLIFIKGDLTKDEIVEKIQEVSEKVDVIVSDMSPRISGNRTYDQGRFFDLCVHVLDLSKKILRPKGNLIIKTFQGSLMNEFLSMVKKRFLYVKIHRPKASSSKSSEVYIVAKNFIAPRAR